LVHKSDDSLCHATLFFFLQLHPKILFHGYNPHEPPLDYLEGIQFIARVTVESERGSWLRCLVGLCRLFLRVPRCNPSPWNESDGICMRLWWKNWEYLLSASDRHAKKVHVHIPCRANEAAIQRFVSNMLFVQRAETMEGSLWYVLVSRVINYSLLMHLENFLAHFYHAFEFLTMLLLFTKLDSLVSLHPLWLDTETLC
jgi:hypothetical protein